ncbi:MAG: hypothetical protein JWM85_1722 [Acidimicrobiaceae bacterium]|nr:hypothetical protein [Acidimicrobiaceae bacterium]
MNSEEQECYSPSQVSVSGGNLNLSLVAQSQTCGGVTRPNTSGLVSTNGKFSYTYGFAEARIYIPASGSGTADWPAFWGDGQSWPADGEMDIMEGLSGKACWHFISPAGNPGGCPTGTNFSGWHTFASDWEPGSVTYYYDGVKVGQLTSNITSAPMYLILNLAVDTKFGGPQVIPADMLVDYVRVWQH